MLERGAQSRLHRAELCLERAPVIYRVLANGLPHLLRARGAHRPLRLVEAEAGLVERHSEVMQETTDFGLGVLDQPLVDQAVDATR